MDTNEYLKLGTCNKRKEKKSDHRRLKRLMEKQWIEIRDFSKRSPEQIREWQFEKIKRLIKHAFNTVPLYKEKYSSVGFSPEDLKNWSDFEKLPLLTKEELIASFPEKSVSCKHNFEFTTRSSGSSGQFVTLAVSPDAIYVDTIQGARQFYFQSGKNFKEEDRVLFIYTAPWWVSSIDGKYRTGFLPTTTKIEDAIKTIEHLHPTALSVYPTYLISIYEKQAKLKEQGVKLIVVHSEQSTPKLRKELSDFFEIPVLDEFSSEELTRISLECPLHRYHLEEDACYIEILNEKDNSPARNGERGRVIGTNLLNKATPIIRYSQGDLAALIGNIGCECNSNFRVIGSPEGRIMDSVILPNGEQIPASCFMDLAYNWYLELDIPVHGLKYQIVQSTPNKVDIYLIPKYFSLSPSQLNRIKSSMYQILPHQLEVETNVVKEPPIDKGVKYRPVISLVKKVDANER